MTITFPMTLDIMTRKYPRRDAIAVTSIFAGFGVIGWLIGNASVFAIALYLLLLVHTYFSMDCFFRLIDPRDRKQQAVDALLVLCYLALALSFFDIRQFLFAWAVLFCVSAMKYALLIGTLHQPRLLRRKIIANVSALLLAVVAALGSVLINPLVPMLVLFASASGYYFFVNPLYAADRKEKDPRRDREGGA